MNDSLPTHPAFFKILIRIRDEKNLLSKYIIHKGKVLWSMRHFP